VIVREDLPRGVLAAQLTHAAGESAALWSSLRDGAGPGRTLPENTHAVVLAVPNERALLAVADRLSARSIVYTLIREPDAPFHGEGTAIGLAPVSDRREVRRALSNLPLLR